MKLRSITITKLPGIEKRLNIEGLDSGVNFITGPNASGKSSIIRALRYLLTPRQKTDPVDLILEAEFEIGDITWSVTRTSQDPIWRRAGELSPSPNLPKADALDAHLIRIEDLLAMEQRRDDALADTLRIEMDGGFNLREIRESLAESARATARSERSSVEKTQDQFNRLKNQHRSLAQKQATLPTLEQAIARAEQAQSTVKRLEQSLEALALKSKISGLDERIQQLPAALAHLTGQEIEQLNALEQSQEKWKQTEQKLNDRLAEHRRALEGSGLEKNLPESEIIASAEAYLHQLTNLARNIQDQEQKKALIQARLEQARVRLDPAGTHTLDTWPQLTVDDINQAQRLARAIDRAHQQSLSAQPTHSSTTPKKWWGLVTLGISIALVGVGLGQPMLSILSLVGVLALALLRLLHRPELNDKSIATKPDSLSELEEEAEALRKTLGFQPALLGEHAALVFSDAYRQFQAAQDEYTDVMAALAHDDQCSRHLTTNIHELLAPFGWVGAASFGDSFGESSSKSSAFVRTQTALKDWIERAKMAHLLVDQMAETENQLQQAQQELSAVWHQAETIYQQAGLLYGQKAQLENILGQKPLWQEITKNKNDAQTLLQDRLSYLKDQPEWLTLIEDNAHEELNLRLQRYRKEAEKLPELHEARAELKEETKQATKGQQLSQANAAHEAAIERLVAKRHDVLLAECGLFWLENIEHQTRQASGERIFDLAQALFASFTHHQWEMRLDEDFSAIRTKDQAPMALSQLSTATRMQLLLAVRIARMLKSEEHHESLPLFIDEALTTSDPQRAATIIDNLQTIAEDEQRQIIYMAASDYELQLWQHLTQQTPKLIQLESTDTADSHEAMTLSFEPADTIPSPAGRSKEEYANALGIGPWTAHQPIESMHLFYLLADDLDLLYRLMSQWRISSLGPLERWLASQSGTHQLSTEQCAQLKRRCQLARRWWMLWHQGRPIPMDESVIHQALDVGGLTPTTLPGVLKAAREVSFDADLLLVFLQDHPLDTGKSKRKLSQTKWSELAEFLKDRGHVCHEATHSLEEVRMRTLEPLTETISPPELMALQQLIDRLEQGQPQ